MTSVQQLAAVRVLLDEASPDFYSDASIYASLAEAQNAAISILLGSYRVKKKSNSNIKMPYELEALLNDVVGAVDAVNVSAGFMELISATYDHDGSGGENPCTISTIQKVQFNEDNTYLAATGDSPVVYVKTTTDAVLINFLPAKSGTPSFTYWFIVSPTDIASGQNPTLPETTHDAMVFYAAAKLFEKDDELQKSQYWMNLFNQEIGKLNG